MDSSIALPSINSFNTTVSEAGYPAKPGIEKRPGELTLLSTGVRGGLGA